MKSYDVIIIGAGAAGLSAAGILVKRGKRVALVDMGAQAGRKVMASGGGRCNITNAAVKHDRYFGCNPNFVRSAISRTTPGDIIEWAQSHGIKLFEKNPGQYFCSGGARGVLDALMRDAQGAEFIFNTNVSEIQKRESDFIVNDCVAKSVIIATGGTSFGVLGVSDAGYKIAHKLGHKIIPVRPALCALAFAGAPSHLAGVSLDAEITINKSVVRDSLLFTHFGIGGPAAYRASLYDIGNGIYLNLLPGMNVFEKLRELKCSHGRKKLSTVLSELLPISVAKWIADTEMRNVADIKDKELGQIADKITKIFIPAQNIKYHSMASAEVVRGGVDTNQVSSKTMESKVCPGLFFAGEVLDVAGDLGGFNLHWAWASGRVAGENA